MPRSIETGFDQAIAHLYTGGFNTLMCMLDGELLCDRVRITLKDCNVLVEKMYYFPNSDEIGNDKMLYGVCIPQYDIKGILSIDGTYNIIAFIDLVNNKRCCEVLNAAEQ